MPFFCVIGKNQLLFTGGYNVAKFLVQKSGPLQGEVTISGSKNAVLPILAATLLTKEDCTILDVPALRDVDVMCKLLSSLGAEVRLEDAPHAFRPHGD